VGQDTTKGGGASTNAGIDEERVSSFVTISFTIFFVVFFSLGLRPFFIGVTSSGSSSSSRDSSCVTILG